jgi:hypothetical protein
MQRLYFGKGNSKLGKDTFTFSLPAGWTCPGALDCLARAARETGKITDGPKQKFRCFSATMETYKVSVRNTRWNNFDILRTAATRQKMAKLLCESLPRNARLVRIHVAGDFYNKAYFEAWLDTANANPNVVFYAYTKSVHLLPPRADLPANIRIVVSNGTRYGIKRARELGYAIATVEMSPHTSLPIDHDDTHPIAADADFALLLHGTQPAGSDAARALAEVKRAGFNGYRA